MTALDAAAGRETAPLLVPALCIAGAVIVAALAFAWIPSSGLGPFAGHMLQHVVIMNMAAPLVAFPLAQSVRLPGRGATILLAVATLSQVALLWGWHAPAVFAGAMASPPLMTGMHISLFAAALAFWTAIFSFRDIDRWRGIVALLITGKLFCLLGALFIFAGLPLFAGPAHLHEGHRAMAAGSLQDQQLAGLIMVVACPLTYVAAGVIIAALWLRDLERDASRDPAWLRGAAR